jgi:hypothetical protein
MTIEEMRARLVEHLAIRAYRTEDGDPALKALVEYERAVRAEAAREERDRRGVEVSEANQRAWAAEDDALAARAEVVRVTKELDLREAGRVMACNLLDAANAEVVGLAEERAALREAVAEVTLGCGECNGHGFMMLADDGRETRVPCGSCRRARDRRIRAALLDAASPADLGRQTIEEAEERGARWAVEQLLSPTVGKDDAAREVCRAARKEGTR